jgi:hypothetical protein
LQPGVSVLLYLGIDSLFEDNLLVFLEFVTVCQTLVLVLTHVLTTYAWALRHRTVPLFTIKITDKAFLNPIYKTRKHNCVKKNISQEFHHFSVLSGLAEIITLS